MNTMFAANSSSSLDDFLQNLPKKVAAKSNGKSAAEENIAESSNTDITNIAELGLFDSSLADLFDAFVRALPLILIFSTIITAMVFMLWRYYDAKRSKSRYLTTLTPKHYTPEVFHILGKQCHLLAYRTGYGFALLAIRIVNEKVSKKQHGEFAYCLASCLREDDVICDYSNGHFKVLLPYLAEVIDYEIVLYRLRSNLFRTSVGVNNVEFSSTVFPDGGSTFQQMLTASNRSFEPL